MTLRKTCLKPQPRSDRRFRPLLPESNLETRVLLSGTDVLIGVQPRSNRPSAIVAPLARANQTRQRVVLRHVTPASEINAQYDKFLADFRQVEQFYVEAINNQSTNTVQVSSATTATYVVSSAEIQVQNGSVFGPNGLFTTPIAAVASINGVPVAELVLAGRSNNSLILDQSQLPTVSLQTGTLISATVPASTQTSAATIFPTYIVNRTSQMAYDLVAFFNVTQLKLPKFNAPPHQPNSRGAIQSFVFKQIVGTSISSLQQSLLLIPLPTTAGSDLTIYDYAVDAAVAQSRRATLTGVRQIFAGKLLIPAPSPANRLGVVGGSDSGTSTGGSTSGTSSTTGGSTGSTSTG